MGRGCAKKSCAPPLNLIPSLNLISEFAPDKSNVEDIITYALNLEKIKPLCRMVKIVVPYWSNLEGEKNHFKTHFFQDLSFF